MAKTRLNQAEGISFLIEVLDITNKTKCTLKKNAIN